MIRFDGYYIFEPILYQERKEWEPWYSLNAFLFLKNGKVIITSKFVKNKNERQFLKNEFKDKNGSCKYFVSDKEMYLHKYIGKQWESKFYYDRISNEEFVSRQTGTVMKFMPWPATDDKEG